LPLEVELNHHGDVKPYVPLTSFWSGALYLVTRPQLAVDPTNPKRLFLVYHDLSDNQGSTNVNIYLRVLTRNPVFDTWSASLPVQVNDDDPVPESDQFHPSITVDANGVIHVIFYDDRRFDQEDGPADPLPAPQPKYDVFYAWAVPPEPGQPWFWTNEKLWWQTQGPGDPPALDLNDDSLELFEAGEYIGISFWGNDVWTSFAGSDFDDPDDNKSVIWSSRIPWP
jgi:hypothetical protein